MKKAAAQAKTNANTAKPGKELPGKIANHEHIHATNCGHRSFVHGNHVDYEHDGHYHYVVDGKTYECTGPDAKVMPFAKPAGNPNK